jgi:hypothetical protein
VFPRGWLAGRYPSAMTDRTFPHDVIERLDREPEIDVETHSPDGAVRRTTIWVVVDAGEVFIRSVNGTRARWYREAVAGTDAAIWIGDDRVPVRVSEATSAGDIARCSRVLESKYAGDPSVGAMLEPSVLDSTLRVVPA